MVRTIISVEESDKQWLDLKAAREGVSLAHIVREAIARMRDEEARTREFNELLDATAGVVRGEDGLKVVKRLRDEWHSRSR